MKTDRDRNPRTLVVGAGIAGLATAAALARRGVEVCVFERAASISPVGAGITIQANATAVLRALGIELPAEDVVPIGNVEVVDARGRALVRGDAGALMPDPPSMNVHRADLHKALLAACKRVPLVTDSPVAGVAEDEGRAVVHLEDGRSESGDLVIGADGIHSTVRRSLAVDEDFTLRYSGQTCWRFALEAPELVPQVTTERWSPGRRAGIVPLSRGRLYVYLVESAPRNTPGPGSNSPEVVRAHFRGLHPQLDAVLERLDARVLIDHSDLCDRPRVHFGRGRVVLVGDAAHSMTPNLGQGAGMAIEDAAALSLLLPEHREQVERLPDALDRLRHERVETVVKLAWRIGRTAHFRNPFARFVRDQLIRSLPAAVTNSQVYRLWKPGLELASRTTAEGRRASGGR